MRNNIFLGLRLLALWFAGCAAVGVFLQVIYSYLEEKEKPAMEQLLCEYSKYNTSDYAVIRDQIYCMSAPGHYQHLKKPKPRSPHLEEHKSKP